jgi:hypothetical protein
MSDDTVNQSLGAQNNNNRRTPEEWVAMVNRQIGHLQQRTEELESTRVTSALTVKPPKPDCFYGNQRGQKVDLWIFEMEQYFNVVGLVDPHRVPFAASFLRDSAATWWRARQLSLVGLQSASLSKWVDFSCALLEQFKPLNASRIARDRLHRLRQTGSVLQLTSLFNTLCADVPNMSEDEKMDKFRRACKPAIQQKLELEEPKTLFEMQTMAQRIDQIYWTVRESNNVSTVGIRPRNGYGQRYYNPDAMEVDVMQEQVEDREEINTIRSCRNQTTKLSSTERTRCIQHGLCFRCRKGGHMMRECPLILKSNKKPVKSSFRSKTSRSGKGRAQ